MPDNVLNAMRGLTEYLMKENQLLDQKRKEEKINTAAERIADAYKQLPPSASVDEITSLGFRAIEDAASFGTVQEMMPLINQMQQSTLATYQIRKGEQTSNAVRQQVEQWTGQKFAPGIGGEEAVDLTQLARTLNPPETYIGPDKKTYVRKFNPDGTIKSESLINAFGAQEELGVFKQQEDIKFQHDVALANIRGAWQVRTASAGVGPGNTLDVTGAKLMKGYKGQNGEVLYTDAKGRGVYALQPDNTLLFYNQLPVKATEEDLKDQVNTVEGIQGITSQAKIGAYNTIKTTLGEQFIKDLSGQTQLTYDANGNPTAANMDALYKALDQKDWKTLLGTELQRHGDKMNTPEQIAQHKRNWNAVESFKNVMYNEQQLIKKAMGIKPGTTSDASSLPEGVTQQSWNKGNQTLQNIFQSNTNPKVKTALQKWISERMGQGTLPETIDFNSISKLPVEVQGELIKLTNQYIK